MNKLELKHIVGYLPYNLKVKYRGYRANDIQIFEMDSILLNNNDWDFGFTNTRDRVADKDVFLWIKPILRPISSMTKEEAYQLGVLITNKNEMEDKTVGIGKITVGEWEVPIINYTDIDGEEYSFMVMFCNHGISATNDNNMTFEAYEWLYKNHFDIYGLIEQNLAININTL